MRLTFDANILVYAADATSEHHDRAARLLRRGTTGDCLHMLQSLGETFVVLLHKRKFAIVDAHAAVADIRRLFPIIHAEPPDLDEAIRVCAEHKTRFWDSFLWATAKRAGCALILSQDFQDGRALEGVTILDPFNPDNARLIDLALPPTE